MPEQNDNLDITLRDLLNAIKQSQRGSAVSAAGEALGTAANDLLNALTAHASQRSNVHGVGPGFVIAKTANPAGFVRWVEIAGKPAYLDTTVDPATFEFDASQLTSGIININRLPVALPGVSANNQIVRADDPRLTARIFVLRTSEPLSQGDFITPHVVAGTARIKRASAASPATAAIGYVAESFGADALAEVFPIGINSTVGMTSALSMADVTRTVFLAVSPGKGSFTPATGFGQLRQPLGTITDVPNSAIAEVAVRWEWRIVNN